ncbi:hypothetical protein DPEC_G00320960 [Dallia pectoralis]|uniref:Uncharacterized protein n=1 Tax=Dallia pectoralis TaxID=75939 RepID=A0ACC2FA09_DALPE|nr:hypothetical protein DPEC_G00320960 [Dallia pectoralis]
MGKHRATGQSSFTISVVCGIFFASFSISPHGGLCGLTCDPSPVAPLQELVHRSRVVFEGKLQGERRKGDASRPEREKLQRTDGQVDASHPNRTSAPEPDRVMIRVYQVWEIKAGGVEKDSIVSIVLSRGNNCLTLTKNTKYMFFMDPTNDTSVFQAVFPPVVTRRAVRKDVKMLQETG